MAALGAAALLVTARVTKALLLAGLVITALLGWRLSGVPAAYTAVATVSSVPAQQVAREVADPAVRRAILEPLAITGGGPVSLSAQAGTDAGTTRIQATAPDPGLAADVADAASARMLAHHPGAKVIHPAEVPLHPDGHGPRPLLLVVILGACVLPLLLLLTTQWRQPHGETAADAARHRPHPLRTDIEGLRAIAVGTVVLWHAGFAWVPGGFTGVDIFFVISGYLMSGVLLRQVAQTGRVNLRNFYARRARRLLPAALAALVGAAVILLLALPRSRWPSGGRDIVASATYLVNWRMAAQSVDYLSADVLPSPVQHFWSLSVEEQFYLLWPLLCLGCAVLAARLGWSMARTVLWASAGVLLLSLATSLTWTSRSGPAAYFVTPTRVWELALGSVVACVPALGGRLGARWARLGAWGGLALITAGVLLIRADAPFPGWRALIPTVGTALLLWCCPATPTGGPGRLLALAPMQWLGRLSYSVYLWHWPFIVVAMAWTSTTTHPPLGAGLLAAAAALVPAWLSFRFVEDPVRRHADALPANRRDAASLYLGATNSAAAALTGIVVLTFAWPATGLPSTIRWSVPDDVYAVRGPIGAQVLGDHPTTSPAGAVQDRAPGAIPSLDRVALDTGTVDTRDPCTTDLEATTPVECPVGDPRGTKLLVVVGDSHAKQWLPALDVIAKQRHWRVIGLTKSSCPPLDGMVLPRAGQAGGYTQCVAWNQQVATLIASLRPTVIVTSWARYSVDEGSFERAASRALTGYVRATGASVVLIHDTPRPTQNMAECLLAHPDHQSACAFSRADGTGRNGTAQADVLAANPSFTGVGLTDYICPRAMCAPVIGGVVVYRDSNHLTDTYVRSLTDRVRVALAAVGF